MDFTVSPIGHIQADEQGFSLCIDEPFRAGLEALQGFSHLQALCWFDRCDTPEARRILTVPSPYKGAPAQMGIFATRSPARPNPIALCTVQALSTPRAQGIIPIAYTDALDGTPILDIKPYTPSLDRVENPQVPAWCKDWPKSLEASADFDWEGVFNF